VLISVSWSTTGLATGGSKMASIGSVLVALGIPLAFFKRRGWF
jgi:hypothetical protein